MEYKEIEFGIKDNIAIITLNSPKNLNALSLPMAREIINALEIAQNEARVLVVTGLGRAFCSGADLSQDRINDLNKGDIGLALDTTYNPLILALKNSDIPIICAINGAAVGIGCPLALMGDIIIAAKSAYFSQGFLNIGLIPDGGSTYLLAKSIGRVKAMEMMLLGEKISAQDALNMGLITQIVPDEELQINAQNLAIKLCKGPKLAIKLLREIAWSALDNNFESQLQIERIAQKDAGNSKDFIEGVTAFMQKRPPNFNGE